MSLPIMTSNPNLDAERRRGLRRMRTVAVGLLVLAATVYLLTLGSDGFLGFVNAGAEASMVGAMADWFAVTALFKHPLGLPIPHTALIPRRKEMLGRSLEEFVGENFLQEQVIRDRFASADVARKVGDWLVVPQNASRIVDEAADLLRIGLARVKDEDLAAIVSEVLVPRLVEEPLSPVAGSLLKEIVEDKAHYGLVDLVVEETVEWLRANPQTFSDLVIERAPWWAPQAINVRVTRRLHIELVAWLEEIRDNPDDSARLALDKMLAALADDLLNDPQVQERTEELKRRVLTHPQVTVTATSLWNSFRRVLIAALEDSDGMLLRRANEELVRFGARLQNDNQLRAWLDQQATDLAVFVVGRYGGELTAVITHTVDRWDGREASRRIELFVGKDLQYIRINGTLVGGLVGLVIHAVSVAIR
jgi:uncharacterized membrane-anchored protein YjiN (DUF445 family)